MLLSINLTFICPINKKLCFPSRSQASVQAKRDSSIDKDEMSNWKDRAEKKAINNY